jgi:2-oxoisovalerate dehydrogenase E2 component (dihydrolipoyl transacylase)
MTQYVMRLPDLGEGLVSAEISEWRVQTGDIVREDQPLVEMSTDKALVEVAAPVSGRVVSLSGAPGESIAVGAPLVIFDLDELSASTPAAASTQSPTQSPTQSSTHISTHQPQRVRASPATRRLAYEAGINLQTISGSGPGGRIVRGDLVRDESTSNPSVKEEVSDVLGPYDEIPLVGVRRVIAQRMVAAKRNAPHFAYVEEVDVTALECLRQTYHAESDASGGTADSSALRLSYLPFIARALMNVLADFPQCNAHFDEARNVLRRFHAVHLGIATHTPQGLKVPVVRAAQRLDLSDLAAHLQRVTQAAREGTAAREQLKGSTITLTSLGKLGGIVSTPILNLPEVAIIGVNKAVERVVVHDGKIAVRRIMNLSSSFDHRVVDGYDAAAMIQRLKSELEQPEQIFRSGMR